MGAGESDRRAGLAGRLDVIAEELSDLAMDALRDALERGDPDRPVEERRLTQARRSVEKAAHLLRSLEHADDDGTAQG